MLQKTPRKGTKREIAGIREAVAVAKPVTQILRDVDVGWERSEPMEQVKHLLPVSAVRTHMKLEIDGTASRFRLTEQST